MELRRLFLASLFALTLGHGCGLGPKPEDPGLLSDEPTAGEGSGGSAATGAGGDNGFMAGSGGDGGAREMSTGGEAGKAGPQDAGTAVSDGSTLDGSYDAPLVDAAADALPDAARDGGGEALSMDAGVDGAAVDGAADTSESGAAVEAGARDNADSGT